MGQIEGAILLDWDEGSAVLEDTGGDSSEDKVTQAVMEAARKELSEFHAKVLPIPLLGQYPNLLRLSNITKARTC